MRVILACFAIPLAISAALAVDHPSSPHNVLALKDSAARRGVAYFEPPRSVGTPLADLARSYSGYGLADRIAGRFRLESDRTLNEAARQIIRRHLMQGS
ncbi:MAG TPA: hypothetical protein VF252_11275 [Gemmatimonadales bacterium]